MNFILLFPKSIKINFILPYENILSEASGLVKVMIYESFFMDKYLPDSFSSYLNICDCAFPSFPRLFDFILFYYETIKKCSWKIKKKILKKNNFYWRGGS